MVNVEEHLVRGIKGKRPAQEEESVWVLKVVKCLCSDVYQNVGFSNAQCKKDVVALDISVLNSFNDGQEVTRALLLESGIIKSRRSKGAYLLKFIGAEALERKLVVMADQFSKGALEAINNAGGNAVVVAKES